MAVTRRSLSALRRLRGEVGRVADRAASSVRGAWAGVRNDLAGDWKAAADASADLTQQSGRQPSPWQLARLPEVGDAIRRSESALGRLGANSQRTVVVAAGDAIDATLAGEPRIIETQLPDAASVLAQFRRGVQQASAYRLSRTDRDRIQRTLDVLPVQTSRALQQTLIRGGDPNTAGQRIGQVFDHGSQRAQNTAQTETLDAYRAASADAGRYHEQIVAGWLWICACDKRSCPSCWALHGSLWPLTQVGPLDHAQGRCARLLKLHPWARLGVRGREPADQIPDARAVFARLSRTDQIAVMGTARLAMLDAGDIAWTDLATLRPGRGWRDAYTPTSVADLRRIAGRRAA